MQIDLPENEGGYTEDNFTVESPTLVIFHFLFASAKSILRRCVQHKNVVEHKPCVHTLTWFFLPTSSLKKSRILNLKVFPVIHTNQEFL